MNFIKNFWKQDEAGFVALVVIYILLSGITAYAAGYGDYFEVLMYLRVGISTALMFAAAYIFYRLCRCIYLIGRYWPGEPVAFLLADLKKGPLRPHLYRHAAPIFIAFMFFFSTFTSMKMLIPRMNTFKYDEFFMHADYVLHIGADPWRIVHSFLGYPALTAIISFLYGLWLPVFFLVLYWQMFRLKNPQLRMQFFYTFALTWAVNGTLVAMLLPAAGPCFYKLVLQSDYYKPLMDYLYEVNKTLPIHAVTTQEMLWRNYTETERITGGGISAFPSVHVATAFLYVLVGYRSNKWIYALCIAFFTVILLGSVHLGWHYAVDGYFAILSTYALWWGAGKFLKWRKTKAGAF